MAPKEKQGFTESDKAELDELLEERRFDDLLKARRKKRIDAVRGWASLVVLLIAVVTQVGGLVVSAWEQIRTWVSR